MDDAGNGTPPSSLAEPPLKRLQPPPANHCQRCAGTPVGGLRADTFPK